MTIVLPYKEDILSGVELLFALRSIDKYLEGFTNLIIVGDPPEWYNGESIRGLDISGRKQYSIYKKIINACKYGYHTGNFTDKFVMWNDDHFLLKELNVIQIRNWYDGYLKDTVKKGTHGSRYIETINNTLELIPETFNYDIHTPCIYDRDAFVMLFKNRRDEICIKSFYFNYWANGLDCEMKDFKINQLLSKEAIKELIKDRLFLSTSTNGMKKPMIELLNELFPEPSRFEK